ncbi:diguanylate cyclase domain-containing protein [Desulfobacterium sp. N47]|uniref:diguanylate cyclase domain-containing protein n=1 Tax=Desulfobacterium sp. N47 TaxID=3115210 RepID=UPI003F49E923
MPRQSLGTITISLGISVFPEHGLTKDVVMKAAGNALYSVKKSGRDRVVVAEVRNVAE